jgi:hypothetical protein
VPRVLIRLLFAAVFAASLSGPTPVFQPAARAAQDTFAGRIAALSEPGGYFDTDNLISNERSFLHVAPELRALAKQASQSGVYVGVGPDQNFSYIGHLRPSLAILVDIRRDNLLLHLLFKALFAESRTRAEYLAQLTGREMPAIDSGWERSSIDAIVKYIDSAKPLPPKGVAALQSRLIGGILAFGVPLTPQERQTILTFHQRFIAAGLSLQFNSTGRAPQYDYPTYRDLILEVDRKGVRQSFLASEDDFQFVKSMHAKNLIVPIVGDLAGNGALAALAKFLVATSRQVSAFYTSNVEFYLFQNGTFPRFVANLRRLPHQPGSLVIRSVFPSGRAPTAMSPGYNSASLTQPIQVLLDGYAQGRYRQYGELVR